MHTISPLFQLFFHKLQMLQYVTHCAYSGYALLEGFGDSRTITLRS